MFGFFKRLRERGRPSDAAPPDAAAEPAARASSEDERPGRSWYASSLDLHDGLEVSDADDGEHTLPQALGDR